MRCRVRCANPHPEPYSIADLRADAHRPRYVDCFSDRDGDGPKRLSNT